MLHEHLENGIELVLKENHFAGLVAIQGWVGVGSLYEQADERGMSHLIEHMLFKGTKKRKVGEIACTVEASGGEVNAYTSFDRTVYYLTMASNYAELGVDLLADALFSSSFDPIELEREKEVVIEEIRRSLDSPAAVIGRKVFELAYAGCEAARPILGYEDEVRSFSRDQLMAFYRKWYQPENLKLVVVGDFDLKQMRDSLHAHFNQPKSQFCFPKTIERRNYPKNPTFRVVKGDYQKPRIELCFPAPGVEHPDSVYLDLAAFALGHGDSARLNRVVREQKGLVNAISASVYAPSFDGIFSVSCFPEKEHISEALMAILAEIQALKNELPFQDDELQRARATLRSERCYQEETIEGQARALGFGLTTSAKYLFDDIYLARVSQARIEAVQEAVSRWLDFEHVIVCVLVNEKSDYNQSMLESAYRQVSECQHLKSVDPDLIKGNDEKQIADPEFYEISEGLSVVFRQNPNTEFFSFCAVCEGGQRAENKQNSGLYYALSELLVKQTCQHSYEQLLSLIEGSGSSLEGFSGKDSFGLRLQCLTEHVDSMLELFFECLFQAEFNRAHWQTTKREIIQQIDALEDSPAQIALRHFYKLVYNDQHPYGFDLYGSKESIASLNCEVFADEFVKRRDQGHWVLGCVAPFSKEIVEKKLLAHVGNFKPRPNREIFALADHTRGFSQASENFIFKRREQTHIILGYSGLSWDSPDRVCLDMISTILGGQGGRLFTKLRDEHSLAYTVTPLNSFGVHPGFFAVYIATASEKASLAIELLGHELERIKQEEVGLEEIERAKNYLAGAHESEYQRSDAQALTMSLMQLYGVGYNDFLRYRSRLERISADDIQRLAQSLFDPSRRILVCVGPKNPLET